MASGAVASLDQRALERYQKDFYQYADLVYRFGVILTSSKAGAERLTEETFRELIEGFGQIKANANPIEVLIKFSWKAWGRVRTESFHPWNNPTVSALKPLDEDERAALYIVDMIGISVKEAAQIIGSSESHIRRSLAGARGRFVSGAISL
jgi:DNA-directed RNA polymerase specialized sigma24 family protein